MLAVLNDPAARRSDSVRFRSSAYGVKWAEVYTGGGSELPARGEQGLAGIAPGKVP